MRREAVVFVPKLAAASAATCKYTTMHAAICYLWAAINYIGPVLAARVLATRQLDYSLSR